jgi:hypothetical protein
VDARPRGRRFPVFIGNQKIVCDRWISLHSGCGELSLLGIDSLQIVA